MKGKKETKKIRKIKKKEIRKCSRMAVAPYEYTNKKENRK